MWSSHSFRIASWNASAEALIGASAADDCCFEALVPPLAARTAASASAGSRHAITAAVTIIPRELLLVVIANLLIIRRMPRAEGGTIRLPPSPARGVCSQTEREPAEAEPLPSVAAYPGCPLHR